MYIALSVLLFGFGAPFLVLTGADRTYLTLECLLAWLIILYTSVRLGALAERGEKRILSLFYFVFVYIFFGMAPFVELMTRTFIYTGTYTTTEIRVAFALIYISLIAYEVGAAIGGRIRVPPTLTDFMLGRKISMERTVALIVLVPVVTVVLVHLIGGLVMLFIPREEFQSHLRSISGNTGLALFGIAMRLLRVPPYVALYFLWAFYLEHIRRTGYRIAWRYLLPLGFLTLINAVVSNPIATERFWCGMVGLSFFFLTYRWKHKRTFFIWAAGLIFTFVFLFQYMDMFRYSLMGQPIDFSTKALVTQYTERRTDYAEFQVLVECVRYVEVKGPDLGRQFAGSVFFWIPRGIWTHKPYPSGMIVARFAGWGEFESIALVLVGEGYINWGVFGVVLIFFGYGVVNMMMERMWLAAEAPGTRLIQLLVPALAPFQVFALRGSMFDACTYLFPLLLFMVALTRASPVSAQDYALGEREAQPA
jgi:hypothetical protein